MSSEVVPATPGSPPRSGADPLSPPNHPETVVKIPWMQTGPGIMNLHVQGLGLLGNYTAPSIAVIQHYDPLANAIVRDFFCYRRRARP